MLNTERRREAAALIATATAILNLGNGTAHNLLNAFEHGKPTELALSLFWDSVLEYLDETQRLDALALVQAQR